MRFAVSGRRGINMIPILYEKTETEFTSNGIARLSDIKSCLITEGRNDIYECEFEYPITGRHYSDIQEGRIIACTHDETGDVQPFDIYASSKPINGIVTFRAHHISYRQNEISVKPFTAANCVDAIQALKTNSINNNPFTYWTDKTTTGSYKLTTIRSLRGLLGGEEGSLLDIYGTAEFEWDKFTVKMHLHRGVDTDVQIRYGKNLVDINDDTDYSGTYNGVAPFWKGMVTNEETGEQTEQFVCLEDYAVYSENSTYCGRAIVVPLDLSTEYESPPTEDDLEEAALSYLSGAELPNRNIAVDFVQLWQTEEYANYAPLQRCKLCDTVQVIYSQLGINTRQQIITVVWDALLERYSLIELGKPKSTYAQVVNSKTKEEVEQAILEATAETRTALSQAIAAATAMITGANGGYVVINTSADGRPQEVLILDNENIDEAVNVWRWNMNGIGYSSTGYDGTYTTAWTIDGKFNADFITTGTLNAALIEAGSITADHIDLDSLQTNIAYIGDPNSYHLQLDGGEIGFFDGSGAKVAYINNNTLYITQSVVLDEMRVGQDRWSFKLDPSDDSLILKWIG